MRMTTAGRWAAERRQEEEEIGVYKAWAEADAWPDDPAPRGAACERCIGNHSLRTEWEPMPEVDVGLSEPRCRWCDD